MWKPPATAGRFLRHVIMLITVFDFHKSLQLFHVSWSSRARRILAGCVSSTLVPFGHKYRNSCCSIFQGKCFISLSLCRFQTNGARVLAWCETKCKIYTGGPKTLVSVYPFLDFLAARSTLGAKNHSRSDCKLVSDTGINSTTHHSPLLTLQSGSKGLQGAGGSMAEVPLGWWPFVKERSTRQRSVLTVSAPILPLRRSLLMTGQSIAVWPQYWPIKLTSLVDTSNRRGSCAQCMMVAGLWCIYWH